MGADDPLGSDSAMAGDPRVYLFAILATLVLLALMVGLHLLRELWLGRRARRQRERYPSPPDDPKPRGARVWSVDEWDPSGEHER